MPGSWSMNNRGKQKWFTSPHCHSRGAGTFSEHCWHTQEQVTQMLREIRVSQITPLGTNKECCCFLNALVNVASKLNAALHLANIQHICIPTDVDSAFFRCRLITQLSCLHVDLFYCSYHVTLTEGSEQFIQKKAFFKPFLTGAINK